MAKNFFTKYIGRKISKRVRSNRTKVGRKWGGNYGHNSKGLFKSFINPRNH